MRRTSIVIAAMSLSAAVLGAACTPEDVPGDPTYMDDVKPILESRCIRCHGAGGSLNADPDHTGISPGGAPFDGFFTQLDDLCTAMMKTTGCHGLLHYTAAANPPPDASAILKTYIHATTDMRMPPPPSPALTARQIGIFDAWLAHCNSGGCP